MESSTLSNCIIWEGPKDENGYGVLYPKGKRIRVHRMAYEKAYGPFDKFLFVCHKCDNPSCINPEHLFLGTHADNMRDKIKKGRHIKGVDVPSHKLTETMVRQIKLEAGPLKLIATKYGVSISRISDIKHNKTWRHLDAEVQD